MKLSTLLTINAAVGLSLGAVLLLMPQAFLAFNGLRTDPVGLAIARLFGAEFIGFNIATWRARNSRDASARGPVVLGHFVSESIGFFVALLAKLAGLGNTWFWGVVVVYFLFAIGFGYFQLSGPTTGESAGIASS